MRGLVFEQQQLLQELELIGQHISQLETEIVPVVEHSREGKILLSIPGIGQEAAARLIAIVGNIANFEHASQLKSCVFWMGPKSRSIRV